MALSSLPALGIQVPDINPAAAASDARTARINQTSEQMKQQAASIEMLASGAAYALDQGLDGPVNEDKWHEVLDSYKAAGVPDEQLQNLRDHPNLAPVLLRTSHEALQAAHDEQLFPLKLKQMSAELDKTMAETKAANAKPSVTPTDDQRELLQINAERAATGQPPLSLQDFLASKSGGGNGITITNPDGTTTQIGGKGSNAYDVAEGKGLYETASTIAKEGRSATGQIATLGKMRDLLGNDKVYTGIGADQVVQLQRAASAFGMDPAGVQDAETFGALAKKSVLDLAGGSLGTGFSNGDRDYLDAQVPTFSNTKQGNLQLIDVMQKVAEHKIEMAKFAADYKKSHAGKLDWQFDDALATWAEAHPVFDKPSDKKGSSNAPGSPDDRSSKASPADTSGGPAVGSIEPDDEGNKWRFKGGDAGDQRNWERLVN